MSFLAGVLAGVTLMVIIGAIMMPRMGQLFTGEVRQVMQKEVPAELDAILACIIEK